MNVGIKGFKVNMQLGNSGVEFEVRSTNDIDHLGDMIVNKKGLKWCKGQVQVKNGKQKTWEEIIAFMES